MFFSSACVRSGLHAQADDSSGVVLTPPDAGDDLVSAQALSLDPASSLVWSDSIDPPGDKDFFWLPVDPGVMLVATAGATGENSPADPVLRLYDSSGRLLATNDDMPYRAQGSASALVWESLDPLGYRLEVLDWSDWSEESAAAQGGSDYLYELGIFVSPVPEEPLNDTPAQSRASAAHREPYEASWFQDDALTFLGSIEREGDQDYWPVQMEQSAYCQWSLWPGPASSLRPLMTLVDSQGEALAQSTAPFYTGETGFLYDGGILFRAEAGRALFLEFEDSAGLGGPDGYLYPGILSCWDDTLARWETEPNDSTAEATSLLIRAADGEESTYIVRFAGDLGYDGDTSDHFVVGTGLASGLVNPTLDLVIETARQGSPLIASVSVGIPDKKGEIRELASSDGRGEPLGPENEPHIERLRVYGEQISIEVQAQDKTQGAYFGLVILRGTED